MEKNYKLLKHISTPQQEITCGAIFTKRSESKDAAYTCGNYVLHPDYVERNPTWFAEIVEPKFPKGILEFKTKDGKYYDYQGAGNDRNYNSWIRWHIESLKSTITKVKNSSGEVFSVGDEVESYGDKYSIMDFSIHEGELFARVHDCIRVSIDNLTKPSAPKTFTQEQVEAALKESEKWKSFTLFDENKFRKALGI